jgi:hypothetical protein
VAPPAAAAAGSAAPLALAAGAASVAFADGSGGGVAPPGMAVMFSRGRPGAAASGTVVFSCCSIL